MKFNVKSLFVLSFICIPLSVCLAQATAPVSAETPIKKPAKLTPEEIAARRKAFYEKTGGFVSLPTTGPAVYYINAQKTFDDETLAKEIEGIHNVTQFFAKTVKKNVDDPLVAAAEAVSAPTNDVAFAILLVESDKIPALLFAPEERWGILNVSKLISPGDIPANTLEKRFSRELWRVTTWVMGGGMSTLPSAMSAAFSAEELDSIGAVTSPDELNAVLNMGRIRGVACVRKTTFRKAAELGLNPEPGDDVQRKILEEVNAERATAKE